MKRLFLVLLIVLSLTGCVQMEAVYPAVDEIFDKYTVHDTLFFRAAQEALAMEGDLFISTTSYYQPQNAKELSGLYVSDVKETSVRALENQPIATLFEMCDVKSMATRKEGDLQACEFNCGGSGNYYCGVYYVSQDKPLYIGNFSAELAPSGQGFSYEGNGVRYFTQKISPHFYYFDAQT